ncbi:MAG: hypothetical protein ACK4IS_06760 [Erythrobacter sp.]
MMATQNHEARNLAELVLDRNGFSRAERVVAYEVGNTLAMLNLDLQRAFGLRAEEYQVFMVIVFSTVQRYVRAAERDERYLGHEPLPADHRGSISRHRISETLGTPLETVRRAATRLLESGMIEERQRVQLSTKGGTLKRLSEQGITEMVTARFLRAVNVMIELGAAQLPDVPRRQS